MEKLLAIFDYLWGDVSPYSRKFEFEYDYFDFQKYWEANSNPRDRDRFPNPRQTLLKYLKQVRESFGFDVDCVPPGCIPIWFTAHDLGNKTNYDGALSAANFAIHQINNSEMMSVDKMYEVVELKNAVVNYRRIMLLTFTVKAAAAAAATAMEEEEEEETIQAIVLMRNNIFKLKLWRFKPNAPAVDEDAHALSSLYLHNS